MAYNEEANIARTIHAILKQRETSIRIEEVIVVASGCTDRTVPIVEEIALQEPRVRLHVQEKREGKASAINLFLKQAISQIVVLTGADVLPDASALEHLCAPFKNSEVGMVGGRPVPVNDPATFMGHAVHLLWRLHDRLARVQPKLGEVIAFKNVISGIPSDSPVDEISIQALISQLGYRIIYEPACIVYNKGPLTVRDFLRQRRRIYAGHLQICDQQNYQAPTMKAGPIIHQVLADRSFAMRTFVRTIWTLGTILLEGLARLQGYYDYLRKRKHHIWQMVESTKDLEVGSQRLQRVGKAMSVIVFRFLLENIEEDILAHEHEDREVTEVVRKLLPLLRSRLGKGSKLSLSISGPGIMTAALRAGQPEAEQFAKSVQEIVQATPMRIGMRGREVKVMVAYSSLTFAFGPENRSPMVTGPLMQETLTAAQMRGEGNR